jgi:hypothetical protein
MFFNLSLADSFQFHLFLSKIGIHHYRDQFRVIAWGQACLYAFGLSLNYNFFNIPACFNTPLAVCLDLILLSTTNLLFVIGLYQIHGLPSHTFQNNSHILLESL